MQKTPSLSFKEQMSSLSKMEKPLVTAIALMKANLREAGTSASGHQNSTIYRYMNTNQDILAVCYTKKIGESTDKKKTKTTSKTSEVPYMVEVLSMKEDWGIRVDAFDNINPAIPSERRKQTFEAFTPSKGLKVDMWKQYNHF